MKFLSCFGDPSSSTELSESPLLADGRKRGCIFCDVSTETGFNVVWQDDELIAFRDRSPRAAVHLLVIPRQHTADSVRNLTSAHIPLIQRMTSQGQHLALSLSETPNPRIKSGFHIPPFSSVPHLHLHVFVLPHTFIGRFKYPLSNAASAHASKGSTLGRPYDDGENGTTGRERGKGDVKGKEKGWSWFVSAEQTIEILEKGDTVGLSRS